ncbi:MAG: hypothetical protein SWH68_05900 [Thermodesulfobacteriota bacterium]|nr:hypothetical protein [Thermodesulfobacteriota bacterium]
MRMKDIVPGDDTFFARLAEIYEKMDETYDAVAGQYGFGCAGCTDNCCKTRFYNHTYIEYLYLMDGIDALPSDQRDAVGHQAIETCSAIKTAEERGETPRVLCPLNVDGLCDMHGRRLMICRLHGIPYEIHRPGSEPFFGQGCAIFDERCAGMDYIPFDRTPFYRDMAQLEQDLRENAGLTGKFKMTIAEMIVHGLKTDAAG